MRRRACLLLLGLNLGGCTLSLDWMRQYRAQRAITKQDYIGAVTILEQIVDQDPGSERGLNAARTGHLDAKNYRQAIEFYRLIVLRSPDARERKSAQQYIAQIHFENLQEFDAAVIEFERLLKLADNKEEAFRYRMNLAKCHFQMNNLEQSVAELNQLLETKPEGDNLYEIRMLKANVMVANKQPGEAAALWDAILKEFPARAVKENVGLNLVVVYEELQDFEKAIGVLERMRPEYPNPDFLNLRIERLKERQANLPGARGWRK